MSENEITIYVRQGHDVNSALLTSRKFAITAGFNDVKINMIATAVSELAHNIIKYANHGSITLEKKQSVKGNYIEVTSTDQGPGIEDIDSAMQDNMSTSGTLGLGLPGMKRMMDEFHLESEVGVGTTVRLRKWL